MGRVEEGVGAEGGGGGGGVNGQKVYRQNTGDSALYWAADNLG